MGSIGLAIHMPTGFLRKAIHPDIGGTMFQKIQHMGYLTSDLDAAVACVSAGIISLLSSQSEVDWTAIVPKAPLASCDGTKKRGAKIRP